MIDFMVDFRFGLGDEVKSKLNGYKGIVRARTQYLTGCNTYGLQSQKLKSDGNPDDFQWFDESELVIVKKNKVCFCETFTLTEGKIKGSSKGGPLDDSQIPQRSF